MPWFYLISPCKNNKPLKQSFNNLLWPVIILLHAAFLYYGLGYGNIFLKDSAEYLNQSHNLLNHGSWYCGNMNETILPQLFSLRPPLYGFFIMLLHLIMKSNIMIMISQSVLSMINIYLACRIVGSLIPTTLNINYFLCPFLFFPSQFIYANMIMPEMLLQSFVMLAVYSLLQYFNNKNISAFVFYQFFIAVALLVKPVFFIFPFLSLLFFLLIKINTKHKLLLTTCHSIPITAILVVSYINFQHTGVFEYSSIPGKLLINYDARLAAAYNEGDAIALQQIDSIEAYAKQLPSYREKVEYIKDGAINMIKNNSSAFIILNFKGIINFFIDHSRYDMESFSGKIPEENQAGWHSAFKQDGLKGIVHYVSGINFFYFIYLLLSIIVNFILFIGLFRFAALKEIPLQRRFVILSFIFFVAFFTGITGSSRFRVPVFLLIVAANVVSWQMSPPQFKNKINQSVDE